MPLTTRGAPTLSSGRQWVKARSEREEETPPAEVSSFRLERRSELCTPLVLLLASTATRLGSLFAAQGGSVLLPGTPGGLLHGMVSGASALGAVVSRSAAVPWTDRDATRRFEPVDLYQRHEATLHQR